MPDNAIVIENLKPGTPQSVWDAPVTNQIEGFATDISFNHGSDVSFKINLNVAPSATAGYHIEVYRLGYYGGDGATLVTTLAGLTGVAQPNPITDARGVVDAGNWSVSATWHSPADAVSGIYLAKLVRDDNGGTNQIPFIIRDDASHSDIVLQTSDTTWQAYNGWSGRNGQVGGSLYGGFTQPAGLSDDSNLLDYNRAFGVSYNRPILSGESGGTYAGPQDYVFGADFAAVSFLEKNGYSVSYISGVDTDRLGASLLEQHKTFISVGHDEYWSGGQVESVVAARDAGVNLLFWSGNEIYWKTRYENSIVDGTAYRTMISYKESRFNKTDSAQPGDYANVDPSNQWTGLWRDTRFVNSVGPDGVTHIAVGASPENALSGQTSLGDGTGQFGAGLDIPASMAALRFWRDTGIGPGGVNDLAPGIIGYEWDTSPNDAFRPAGLIKLSDTSVPWDDLIARYGNSEAPGTGEHTITLYRAPSGALVFGAGTVFWTWGLSNAHESSPYGANIATTALQQFTVNMFADMGIQPGASDAFLASQGLVRASASDDHVAATAAITSVPDSTPALTSVLLTGTATDNDGNAVTVDGKVAVVEVSVDGGQTWRVANGTTNWNFNWQPTSPGVYTVLARAIDDSLNTPGGSAVASHVVTVTASPGYSLFDPAVTPTGALSNEGQGLELGVKFQSADAGTVTGLRYFRDTGDAADTDVRTGHLWSSTGTLLGTVTFTSTPGQSGWQTGAFATPITIQAGVTYIVSYHTANNYLAATNYFTSAVTGPGNELTAFSSASSGGNGVYAYGAGAVFPNQSFGAANYWADVVFTLGAPATPTTPDLAAASDSGASSTDKITNVAAPTLAGTAVAGATVTLYDGATAVGTGVANAGGAWSITSSALASGSHTLTATATTINGTSAASSGLVVTIDTTAPGAPTTPDMTAASDNGASNTDNSTSISTPTFVGALAGEAGATVTLYEGAIAIGAGVVDASGNWSITSSALSVGAHTIASRAADVAGNPGALSGGLAINILNGPPAAPTTPDLTAATDSGGSSADNITNVTTPTLVGAAAPGATITVYDGATAVGTGVADSGGLWSITTAALTSGSHTLTATASNPYGTSPASSGLVVTIDTAAPAAPTAPDLTAASDDGASSSDNATSITTPTFAGTLAGEAGATVTLYEGATALGSGVVDASGNWSITSSALSLGAHTITARAADVAGNTGALSGGLPVNIVVPPATFSLFGPAVTPTGALANEGQGLELGVKFQAAEAGAITALRYFRDTADAADTDVRTGHLWSSTGTLLGTVTFTSTPGQSGWQVATLTTPVAIQAGVTYIVSYHTADNYLAASNYFASAVSGPGNELTAFSSASSGGNGVFAYGAGAVFPNQTFGAGNYWADVVFTPGPPVAPSTPDLTAASDSGASSTDNITSIAAPTLAGTAVAGATVTLYDGATAVGTGVADAGGAWSITSSTLANGSHTLTATAGTANGTSVASGGLVVTIDTTAPAAPTAPDMTAASDDGASSSDNATSITTPTFIGTLAGEAGATVTLFEGATALGSAVVDASGNWSITSSALSLGVHTITARATDVAGNAGVLSGGLGVTIAALPSGFSLFGPAVTPTGTVSSDGQSVELGVKFQAAESGTITALRYFRDTADAADTDVRTGHLWSSTGTLLGTVTFTSTPGQSGWQVATLTTPVAIQAGVTYIVSYHTANNYLAATNYFTSAVTGPGNELTAFSSASAGGNGVYAYGAGAVFPNQTFGAANYWADVVFAPGPPAAPSTPDLTAASDSGASSTDNITNVAAPTLAGTAVAGATVTLYDGATAVGTGVANAGGAWSITSSALASGSHTLTATATTINGTSAASSGLVVTIDTTAPAAPTAPDLTAASDDGASNSDNATSITSPTFTGTLAGEAGATVTLFEGAAALGSAVVDASGNWSITSSALSLGVHTITSRAVDVAGNTGALSGGLPVTIVAPTTPPPAPTTPDLTSATDSGGSSTDNITNVTTPTLVGAAAPGATITVYDGATAAGTGVADSGGLWSITTAALTSGSHTLTATASNLNGASVASGGLIVTIDTTAPAAPTAPDLTAASDDGASSSDNATSVTSPTFTGTLTGEAGATVTLYEGATALGSGVVDASGNWSITSSALSLGAHTITARGTDVAGNTGALSGGLAVTVVAPPSGFSLFGPAVTPAGAVFNDGLSVELGVKFQVADAGTITALRYFRDTSDAADTDVRTGHLWSSSGTLLGTVTFTSTPGQSGWQVATLATPVAIQAGLTYVVSYHTADNYLAANNYFTSAVSGPGNELTAPSSGSSGGNGVYAYGAGAVFPNQSFSAANYWADVVFTVGAPAAPSAPDLTTAADSGVSSTDNITNVAAPTLAGTAVAGATVTLYDGVTAVGSGVTNAGGAWSVTSSALANGAHTLTAKASNANGTSAASGSLALTIDTAAPGAPSTPDMTAASDNGASNSDDITSLTTPTFSGTLAGEAGATVTLFEGATALGSTVVDASGNWSITSTALSVGDHSITAKAVDVAGNAGALSAGLSVTILSGGPPAAPSTPDLTAATDSGVSSTDNITNVAAPTLAGTAVAGATVTVSDGAAVVGTGVADAGGAWSITTSALANGGHTLTATASNANGTSAASGGLVVTIDATAPAAPTTPDMTAATDNGASSTDNATSITTPTFTGALTGEAGATVTLYDGATALGSAVVSGAGAWSITSSALSIGSHTITARAVDAAGNTGVLSAGLPVTILGAAPAAPSTPDLTAATDSGTSSTDNITNVTAPTLVGTSVAGATVTLYDAATAVGTAIADAGGAWSITSSALASGSHTLTAKASNANGTSIASTGLSVTIDTTAPVAPSTPDMTAATDNGGSNTDNLTSITTPAFTGTLTGGSGAMVTLYDGVNALGSAVVSGAGAWSITSSALSVGAHTITARAVDVAGNVGVLSAGLAITISGDQTLTGTASADTLSGAGGDDSISGAGGNDQLNGNGGADTLIGGTGNDVINGGDGDDRIIISGTQALADTMAGGNGNDTLQVDPAGGALTLADTTNISGIEVFNGGGQVVQGNGNANVLDFSGFATVLGVASIAGLGGADTLIGSGGADTLDGGTGNDLVNGGGGNDLVTGGAGADTLTGGSGDDIFRYTAVSESTSATRDLILDFQGAGVPGGDVIDVSALAGTYVFQGTSAFLGGGTPSVRYVISGGVTDLQFDDGTGGSAEMVIRINAATTFTSGDFIL